MQQGRIPKGRDNELISTPRRELEKLREKQSLEDDASRAVIMDAMLEVCGEFGYRQVTVETVRRRYGGSRQNFYRHFGSKTDCFTAAYSRESERLIQALTSYEIKRLDRKELEEALERLATFVTAEPHRGRALFVEVHVAGGDVLGKRREVIERLSLALDKAGRETGSRHSAPPLAGEFMINVVDQAVSSALVKGETEELSRVVPELADLICQAYGAKA
jgi:AcrR family transcriptional regulator